MNHQELAEAQSRGDWKALGTQAIEHVPFALRALRQRGALFESSLTPDLIQEAMLAAVEAMRSWIPFEYAFSTHIETAVRSHVLDYLFKAFTGGIGSDWVGRGRAETVPEHTSLNADDTGDPDTPELGQVQDNLTYADTDSVPIGFGDPLDEVCRAEADRIVGALMADLPLEDAALMRARYQGEETQQQYADLTGVHQSTVLRREQELLNTLHKKTKSSVKYGTERIDWKGVREHYPAAERFPGFWSGTKGVIEGNPVWAEKTGAVWKDWSWKPQPQDLPPKRRRSLFAPRPV